MKMFHSLLKSKFFNKCKTDLKLTKTRIEMIKRRRNAVQKYLRNDVVDLLKNGLDTNAFVRVQGLIIEMEKSSCYDIIDQYCDHVSNHLAAIDKQRDCPEECREAVASLMYAAARFADLPELRQLRKLFSDRYGTSLDHYVGKEFAEKAKTGPPSKDEKLRLLQEIAAESGLEWSSKALENNLFNESMKGRERETNNSAGFQHDGDVEYSRDAAPFKGIRVDSIGRVAAHNDEHKDKPLMYGSIPAPYTKSEANKKLNTGKPHESFEEINIESVEKPKVRSVRSVRTRGRKPLPDQSSSGDSESDDKRWVFKFLDNNHNGKLDGSLNYYGKKGSDGGKEGPHRASSLPPESSSSPERDNMPRHVRSESYQGTVHPRLPDYDDVVARLAAMKREGKR